MTGCELRISGAQSDCSTNCATTTEAAINGITLDDIVEVSGKVCLIRSPAKY